MDQLGPLPDEADPERWIKAEERAAEIIACIQPNPSSENLRNAIIDHLKQLLQKSFSSQVKVFSFGSVPLKTYLPDEDIDVTIFSKNRNLKDTWANEVHDMLRNEEQNENAEFHVKDVWCLEAEEKKIKCLVGNIMVNIYFNQLGGICRLCFLHEVDYLVNQNHLFKRSILLIKAWCNYECSILGAHRGLISAYALDILVLHLFHAFDISSFGPLKVLYCFLKFYSKFDWNKFCLSIWGRVPINSLPRVYVETPRSNSGELQLTLDACYSRYAVYSSGRINQGQIFRSNFFNVIDPLCFRSNLGSNVCEDNFIKICHEFTTGFSSLSRLFDRPKEYNLVSEVNKFFMHTLDQQRKSIPGVEISLRHAPAPHLTDEEYDILDINFLSHWQNLQYGRTCPIPRRRNMVKLKEGYTELFDRGEIQQTVLYKLSASIRAVIRGVSELHNKRGCLPLKAIMNSADKRKNENAYTLNTWVAEIEEEEKQLNVAEKVNKRGKRKKTERVYSERRFSRKYKEWGVWRPSEEAKLVIRELIRAVAEYHRKGHFHGGLKILRNIAVKREYKENNNEEIRRVVVTLTSGKNDSGGPMNFIEGWENDISDLSATIFGKILGGKDIQEFPRDLQDLHCMLQNASLAVQNLFLIAEHTSLSHWRNKLDYLSRVRAASKGGSDKERKRKIEAVVRKLNISGEGDGHEKAQASRSRRRGKGTCKKGNPGEESWHSKVPPGPLCKLMNDGNEKKYGNDNKELIRFLRNVIEHLNEAKGGGKKYIDHDTEGEYEDMQFVEHRITEAFPLLLVELYKGLYSDGVDV